MHVTVVTIFPEMFESVLRAGVLGKAIDANLITVDFVDPRTYTSDRHRSVDDAPYGGGPGMVMKAPPLLDAVAEAATRSEHASHTVLMSPAGKPLEQRRVRELASVPHIILVCGRYEGIDERVVELAVDEQVSVGDFVLTGGELAAMSIIDSVARYVPGVLGEATSTDEESFSEGLLEYPHYTRPAELRGLSVPAVLTSGDHAKIRRWRLQQATERTLSRRPEMLLSGDLPERIAAFAARTHIALLHHPVMDRTGAVVTSSVTNLDIHDIARSSATYGLAGFWAVTPVASQREKVERIVGSWPDQAGRSKHSPTAPDHRIDALDLLTVAPDLATVIASLRRKFKQTPRVVATSARADGGPARISFAGLTATCLQDDRPLLLVLGTGWGLAESIIDQAKHILAPVSGTPEFNHLSVRSAAATILDRLFGLRA